jgi:hypothetical protein
MNSRYDLGADIKLQPLILKNQNLDSKHYQLILISYTVSNGLSPFNCI